MCKPLISVIIPVYNTFDYLQRGIDSVLNQTYKNVELIVVNDGSTDGSKNLLDEISHGNSNVTVLHQNNLGVSAARNNGLNLIKGEFVCFLDSDDWLSIDAIEFLYDQIKDKENAVSACDRNFVTINNGEYISKRQRVEQPIICIIAKEALLEMGTGRLNLQSSCYKLFPTSLINGSEKIRFHEDISHGEDGLFVFDVLNHATEIVFSSEPKWNILQRPNSATSSGYSPKMLSALNAVDNMIYLSRDRVELQNQLKVYYTRRTIGLVNEYIISKYRDLNERKVLITALKKYQKYFLKSNVKIIEKIKYYIFLYSPEEFVYLLHKISKSIKGS